MLIDPELYEDARRRYLLDTADFDENDIGSKHRIDEYRIVDENFRNELINIPGRYEQFKREKEYEYYRAFNICIEEIVNSPQIQELFAAYNIFARKKYGYYAFVAHYITPKEFNDSEIPHHVRQNMIIQHFQDSAKKIVDDIFSSRLVDLVNVDSLADTSMLELHFEPVGMYELVALNEYDLVEKVKSAESERKKITNKKRLIKYSIIAGAVIVTAIAILTLVL